MDVDPGGGSRGGEGDAFDAAQIVVTPSDGLAQHTLGSLGPADVLRASVRRLARRLEHLCEFMWQCADRETP